MAIQNRRGKWSDFDPSKLKPGEWAVVLNGDPDSQNGESVYMCFNAGSVKRMATYDDMVQNIKNITDNIEQEFTQSLQDALDAAETELNEMVEDASQAAVKASDEAEQSKTAAEAAASKAEQAADTVESALDGLTFSINDNDGGLDIAYTYDTEQEV